MYPVCGTSRKLCSASIDARYNTFLASDFRQMKKLAFIDHSFHQATRSSEFFREILCLEYEVIVFFDHGWRDGPEVDPVAVNKGDFDVILLWQFLPSARNLRRLICKNLFWVPMYDSEWRRADLTWRALSRLNLKVICFSKMLHETARRFGINSYYAQYFPTPSTQTVRYAKPRLFFWQRTGDIDWQLVKEILAGNEVEKIVLKDDPDPFYVFVEPSPDDIERLHIEIVRNLKVAGEGRREDYLRLLSTCNIFIAPRSTEGIGLSFLEAMALGMCVVGADLPTMNEYIRAADNGFLFDPECPLPIDLTGFAECGRRAKAGIVEGRQQWEASVQPLLQFIAEPSTREHSYWAIIMLILYDFARGLKRQVWQIPSRNLKK